VSRRDPAGPEKRSTTATATATARVDLFSMTDEEQDIIAFQEYLRTLTPESLWDVQRHLDSDRYPRRGEAASREIARRRLFYLNPYTPLERKLALSSAVFCFCRLWLQFSMGSPASQSRSCRAKNCPTSTTSRRVAPEPRRSFCRLRALWLRSALP
jgi:hypothetical protein